MSEQQQGQNPNVPDDAASGGVADAEVDENTQDPNEGSDQQDNDGDDDSTDDEQG